MLADQILDRKGRDVATITADATVAEAVATLSERNVGALVVSADGATVEGIVSERDVVRAMASAGHDVLGRTVGELMVAEVFTCDGHTDIERLMDLMTSQRIRHVPIVRDEHLTGIISIGDVVKARIDELATEREQLVDYIRSGR